MYGTNINLLLLNIFEKSHTLVLESMDCSVKVNIVMIGISLK